MYTKLLTLEMLLNFRVKGERIFFVILQIFENNKLNFFFYLLEIFSSSFIFLILKFELLLLKRKKEKC